MFFDPKYFLFVGPAILLGLWAQWRVSSAYAAAARMRSSMTGAQAARRLLDGAGLQSVGIEPIQGHLSDHYDPRHKVLRLSPEVYQGNSLASVGIAAHEAGHAIQDARRYAPLVIRNAAVPLAAFGSNVGIILVIIGAVLSMNAYLIWAGIALFSCVVFFQLINLPVEFNASSRAKALLTEMGIVHPREMQPVNNVLSAAALTYVAATLQAVMVLIYLLSRYGRR